MKPVKDSFAVLTGASGGIGFCLAEALIQKYHCRVLGIGRNRQKLQDAARRLGSAFTYRVMDVTQETAWQALAEDLTAQGQPVDLLIHCAGFLPPFAAACPFNRETLGRTAAVNLNACITGTECLLPLLTRSAHPMIVEIASIDAAAPLAGTGAYALSKAAAKAYFQILREEWRGKIQVCIACPGVTDTPLFEGQTHLKGSEKLIRTVAMRPQRVARTVLRRAVRNKGTIVTGVDGHLLSIGMRLCPNTTLRLCRWVMQRSKLPLFQDVFDTTHQ